MLDTRGICGGDPHTDSCSTAACLASLEEMYRANSGADRGIHSGGCEICKEKKENILFKLSL